VNVKYTSGYTSEDAFLLITQKNKYIISDPRYTEQISYECPEYIIVNWRGEYGTVGNSAAQIATKEGLRTLGFESDHMTFDLYREIQEHTKTELVPTLSVIEKFRMNKSPKEIEYLRASCEIAARAYERIQKDIRPGITEKELAANLSRYMVLEGSDTMPYGNILISGARTSLLHGIPSDKAVEYGDFVLMDYGCQYHGYLSDMTRTLVVGKATPEQRHVYELEQQMVDATEAFLKAGVSSKEAYYVSRKPIEGTKYLDYHYPSMGHGIGMFVHEMPFMSPRVDYTITENTVMTVEPGIYIPGWGGVRIEDTVLITKDGCENLSATATHDLIEL
jgi:Xaa-Pro aminopeptidase